MSSTCRLIGNNANKVILDRPISRVVTYVLERASSDSLAARVTKNSGAFRSFSSASDATKTAYNPRNNTRESPKKYQYHTIDISKPTIRRKTSLDRSNFQRRSMVTITQTKSSDIAPLFTSHVVDDVSSSSSTLPSTPTYIANEETSLIVTENCLKQVERLLKQRRARAEQPENYDDDYFLRVFVDAGGCSGFQYQFEVENDLDDDDDVVVIMAETRDENDIPILRPRVVVDEASMKFLEGSTIDYVIEMIKSAFVVSDNPQSESACGCGSSFAMKNFAKFGAKD